MMQNFAAKRLASSNNYKREINESKQIKYLMQAAVVLFFTNLR